MINDTEAENATKARRKQKIGKKDTCDNNSEHSIPMGEEPQERSHDNKLL